MNDAVVKLRQLVHAECAMVQTQALTNVNLTKEITISVQGLTVQLLSEFQSGKRELKLVQQTLGHVGQKTTEIRKDITDIKKTQSQQMPKTDFHGTKLDLIGQQLGVTFDSIAGKTPKEDQETRASVSEEFKRWKKLEAALGAEGQREANTALCERLRVDRAPGTADWILQNRPLQRWFQGEIPFVVISGDTGSGKTFIAGRIIEHLTELCNTDPEKSMSYFFCRKGPSNRRSLVSALKTMAYDIASDKLFAKHLSDVVKKGDLLAQRPASATSQTDVMFPIQTSDSVSNLQGIL